MEENELSPYILINRHEEPHGGYQIYSISRDETRTVDLDIPPDHTYYFSDGIWGLTGRFRPDEPGRVMLVRLERNRAMIIDVVCIDEFGQESSPIRVCSGVFWGDPDYDYRIFLMAINDEENQATLWMTDMLDDPLFDGEVMDCEYENNFYDAYGRNVRWIRHQLPLSMNFDLAFSLLYLNGELYWIDRTGNVICYSIISGTWRKYDFNYNFINDLGNARPPCAYLAAIHDLEILYIYAHSNQMVWVGELVNGGGDGRSIRPYPQDLLLNHGTLFVNRGQGAIWFENFPFLEYLLRDTISQGPGPDDCRTFYSVTQEWLARKNCHLLACEGMWFLSDNERLGHHMEHHYVNVILDHELEPAPPAEEEEEEEEEPEETVIDQGTVKIIVRRCACTEAEAESNREITQEAVVGNSLSSPNQIQETPDYIRRSNQRNIITPIELFSDEISHEKRATVTANSGELDRDRFYDGGDVVRGCIDVSIESLYCSARVGEFSYRFDQLEEGDYEVDLHFAEIMFTEGPPGMRVFDVFIQEKKVVSVLDVYEKVACNKPFVIQNLTTSVKGKEGLSIRFEGLVGKPIVCGISVRGGCSSSSGIKYEVVPILGEIKEREAQLVVERKLALGPALKRLSLGGGNKENF